MVVKQYIVCTYIRRNLRITTFVVEWDYYTYYAGYVCVCFYFRLRTENRRGDADKFFCRVCDVKLAAEANENHLRPRACV